MQCQCLLSLSLKLIQWLPCNGLHSVSTLTTRRKKLENEFEERLKEARSARDDALDNNELLKRTNQELSSRLQEVSEKNNELHAANENFKEELNKKNFEIGMLQERVKAQETSIKDLKGAFDKIANK